MGVRDDLRLRRARQLGGGGTPAEVYLCEDGDGESVVVKILQARAGSVDGHDLSSFLHKPAQINRIHQELPGLSPYYVSIVGQWQGPGWGAYAMPRVEGVSPVTLLHAGGAGTRGFLETTRSVFEVLGTHGYPASAVPAPPRHGVSTHLDRVARRLSLLERHLDLPPAGEADLQVNGRRVPPVRELLRRAAARADVLATIQPTRLYFPVHGDLNLGNVLVRPDDGAGDVSGHGFTVLDPRGILDHWDPVYDAAKSLFSLTLFDAAMSGGFQIGRSGSRSYELRLRRPIRAYLDAAVDFPAMLATVGFFRQLGRSDPQWPRRLWYSHAFHVLAEAACRLSDLTVRELPGVSGWAARRELALGLHLSGLLLLDDLLSRPGQAEEDPAKHLACLAGAGP